MKLNRKPRKIEDDFNPKGECQMKCQRDVIMTPNGPVIVCHGCKRIVMDNRDKIKNLSENREV